MTEAYFDYQNADAERDKVLTRICIKTSLLASPLIVLFCFAVAMRVNLSVWLTAPVALVLFIASALVIMRGIKQYKSIPPTPRSIWTDEAESYLSTHGVKNLTPPIVSYDQPLEPSGFGIPYVADPYLLYSGTADVEDRGECNIDIRAVGWKLMAFIDGVELDEEAIQPLLARFAGKIKRDASESAIEVSVH